MLTALIAGCGAGATQRPPRAAQDVSSAPDQQTDVQRQAVNCLHQARIVLASERTRPRAEVVTEALQLAVVLRRLNRTPGATRPRHPAVAQCRTRTAELLRGLSTRWHHEAGKTMRQITFTQTRMLYEAYLATFPAARDRRQIAFYLGEVLFKLQRWSEAAAAYNRVVRLDPAGKLKLTREAAYAAVITWKNAAQQADEAAPHTGRTDPRKPRPIPSLQRELLAAFERYLKLVPAAPERAALLYRRARIYYEYNHHPQAVKLLAQLVTKHPDHELSTYAANLLLDSLNLLKRYAALARWVDRMLAEPKLARGQLALTLSQLQLNLGRKQAEQLQRDGKHKACGERYLLLVARYPKSSRRAELLHNAAICFDKARLPGRAIAARKNLITSTPAAALVPQALLKVADSYEAQQQSGLAAHFMEWYTQRFPARREAPAALRRAFALRMARGEYDKARADAKRFGRTYARQRRFTRDAARLELALGAIFEHKGDHAGAARHYANVARRWGRAARGVGLLATVKLAEAQWAGACPVKGVHGVCATPRARAAATRGCQRPLSPTLQLRKRKAAQVGRAQDELTRALAAIKRIGPDRKPGKDDPELRYAAARAAFLAAEPLFETYLAMAPPQLPVIAGATIVSPRTQRALRTYLAAKKLRLTKARAAYQRVVNAAAPPVPDQAVAALARTAQLNLSFADQLLAMPLPRVVPPPALKGSARDDYLKTWRETYCDAMEDQITPLHAAAKQTLQRCTALAARHKLDGCWARLCKQLTAALPAPQAMGRR